METERPAIHIAPSFIEMRRVRQQGNVTVHAPSGVIVSSGRRESNLLPSIGDRRTRFMGFRPATLTPSSFRCTNPRPRHYRALPQRGHSPSEATGTPRRSTGTIGIDSASGIPGRCCLSKVAEQGKVDSNEGRDGGRGDGGGLRCVAGKGAPGHGPLREIHVECPGAGANHRLRKGLDLNFGSAASPFEEQPATCTKAPVVYLSRSRTHAPPSPPSGPLRQRFAHAKRYPWRSTSMRTGSRRNSLESSDPVSRAGSEGSDKRPTNQIIGIVASEHPPQTPPKITSAAHLYAKADVRDVEVDRHNRGEHDQAPNGVLHERQPAAPAAARPQAAGLHQRDAGVEAQGRGHLHQGVTNHSPRQSSRHQ